VVTGLACCHSGKDPAEEGFSVIAIGYFLLGILKVVLVSIPIVVGAVALLIVRVKHAPRSEP